MNGWLEILISLATMLVLFYILQNVMSANNHDNAPKYRVE
jgi:hypothetical protein